MIGDFDIDPPAINDSLSRMVESHRAKTGQSYAAILLFGLWGTADCSPEVRLYAGYRHLADKPDDGSAWLEVSRLHLEMEDAERAERVVDELLRLDCPNLYPQLYGEDPEVQRAYIQAGSGESARAVETLDGVRARHDESPVYHFFLASLLHENGDFTAATAEYRLALAALGKYEEQLEEEEADADVDFREAEEYIGMFLEAADNDRDVPAVVRPLDLSDLREE